MTATAAPHPLVVHPAAPAPEGLRIDARVARPEPGSLSVHFVLEGELARLRVPPARAPAFVNGLWRHTCFEVFLALADEPAYHEWNLSPSGEWAVHAFTGYREGGPAEDLRLAPSSTVLRAGNRFELDATIPLRELSPPHATAALRVGLSAVVEARDGTLSWWALHHPPGKPDFHHADAFALRIEPPGKSRRVEAEPR